MERKSELLEAALQYESMGLAVMPLRENNKKAFVPKWTKQPKADAGQIELWWNENPRYNIGIRTGQISGLLVLDFDSAEAIEFLRSWLAERGLHFPKPWVVKSIRGYHLWFKTDRPYNSPIGLFFEGSGIDARADGACVCAPPSIRDGGQYEWIQGPDEFPLPFVNQNVWDFIRDGEEKAEQAKKKKERKTAGGDCKGLEMPEAISEGSRTSELVALIGSLRAKGLSNDAIRAAVEAENEAKCMPPLTDRELDQEVFPALKRNWPAAHPYTSREMPDKELVDRLIELDAANRFSWSDKGMAELFVAVFTDVNRYNPSKRDWMHFDGIRWRLDLEGLQAKRNAKRLADALRVYAANNTNLEEDKLIEYSKVVIKMMSSRSREIMIKDSRDLNFFTSDQLDQDDYLLNCQNGVLDLSGSEPRFLEHDAGLLLSKACNVEYNPAAECPLWEKSLAEIMEEDAGKIKYLQKLFGISLTGCTREEELYFFYGGTSRNGKSTVAETALYLLGDYATTLSPEALAAKDKNSRQASPDIAKLQGVRLVVASEPPKRMIFDVSLVKTLTGRDSITARNLYESEISFMPRFKLLINSNYLPLINDNTVFASDRIKVIAFNRHFGPDEQNKELKDELREELSGILNWMIAGWYEYLKEGLLPPQSIRESTRRYEQESDKIGMFFEDCLEEVEGSNLAAKDVYERYAEWCSDTGQRVEGRKNFYVELRSRGRLAESGTVGHLTVRNVVPGYAFLDDLEVPFE